MPFDRGWKFLLGDNPAASRPDFADGEWRTVDLPHDWSLEDRPDAPKEVGNWVPPVMLANPNERPKDGPKLMPQVPILAPIVPPSGADSPPDRIGPFDPAASGAGWATGWTVGGIGWYRKPFALPDLAPGEQVELIFDGAYLITEAWLNGTLLGRNINGYLPFSFDLTPHLRRDGSNMLAVRVANEGQTARWYSGSGLYRHVWLRRTGAVRIPDHGVTVRTASVGPQGAILDIGVEIESRGEGPGDVECAVAILDAGGRAVATTSRKIALAPGRSDRIEMTLTLSNPALWSPETPHLYHAEVTLRSGGRITDRQQPRFGIRTLHLSAATGLQINGKSYKLRGACVHHDNGLLGAVAIDRAERRKVELLKANGFNAIRCSHNPHSPAFMEACDELGMIVISELFDNWELPKFSAQGYQNYFKEHWRQDATTWVRRDRNYPSVVMWSMGNEIPEAGSKHGIQIATEMRALILDLDPTRLITNALSSGTMGKSGAAARKLLDLSGYNYGLQAAAKDHGDDPEQIVVLTETFADNAFDVWQQADQSPWLLGEFLWSGIDYLGETGCGSARLANEGTAPNAAMNFMGVDMSNLFVWDYPAYQSGCGDIDILGLRKPASFYRDVVWDRSPLELFVQRPLPAGKVEALTGWGWHDELASWTWPGHEGQPMTVRAYSRGDTVALLLDGKEVARTALTPAHKRKAILTIPYAPGALTAVAYANGKEIGRRTLTTTGPATRLRLRAEQERIGSGPDELAFVFVEVTDAQGRLVPDAAVPVTFTVDDAARLLRAGSANPFGIESFQNARTRTFHGVAQAILQPTGRRGEAVVRVSGEGLIEGRLRLRMV